MIKGIKIGNDGEVYRIESLTDSQQTSRIADLEAANTAKEAKIIAIEEELSGLITQLENLRQRLDDYIRYDDEDGEFDKGSSN